MPIYKLGYEDTIDALKNRASHFINDAYSSDGRYWRNKIDWEPSKLDLALDMNNLHKNAKIHENIKSLMHKPRKPHIIVAYELQTLSGTNENNEMAVFFKRYFLRFGYEEDAVLFKLKYL